MSGRGRDLVLLAEQIAAAVLAAVAVLLIAAAVRSAHAEAAIHCPPQDHPMQAQVLVHGQARWEWVCGESLHVGVKSR